MRRLEDVDKNLVINTDIEKEGMKIHDVLSSPFEIYGIYHTGEKFTRMPRDIAKKVNDGVELLHTHTAGGRVRFKTNSSYVAIFVKMGEAFRVSHQTLTGSCGFDLYVGDEHAGSYIPPFDFGYEYDGIVDLQTEELREITINFPLYSEVKNLYIGLDENAVLESPSPYINKKPVVYYGSSITQGGCASRPGSCYQGIISRKFNLDYINLGFSGSAKGEDEITDYINKIDMSVFILDYDYNAPTVEHLLNTHERMFTKIRQNHPDIPIIMMSRPKIHLNEEEIERRRIVETTYKNALKKGDKNVYFLDGEDLCKLCGAEGSVDKVHPTDLGFMSMALALIKVIEENGILDKGEW